MSYNISFITSLHDIMGCSASIKREEKEGKGEQGGTSEESPQSYSGSSSPPYRPIQKFGHKQLIIRARDVTATALSPRSMKRHSNEHSNP